MKKFFIIILVILSIFLLTSCGKTKFEDLPKEQQTEIQNKIQKDILAPYIQEVVGLAFQNMNASKEETDKITTQKAEEFKQDLIKYLNENYPNVEFDIDKISKIDNSREEKSIEKPKEYKKVSLGQFYEFNNGEDKKIKIKVNDLVWKGKEYGDFIKYTAKNEFLFIRLEGENIGKKATFKWLGNIKLITKDGYEFSISNTEQNPDNLKEGYSGCIECELNPFGKAEQWIVFDIKKVDLAGAKLRFEDDLVDFDL